jgi:uncharacterized protein (DUF433 family)
MTPTTSWISKKADRCGGAACIRDRRIPVWGLVAYRQQGATDEFILQSYQTLTQADLDAAWAYYADNKDEIDRAIRENQQGEEGMDHDSRPKRDANGCDCERETASPAPAQG